jgi:hypothetical protein
LNKRIELINKKKEKLLKNENSLKKEQDKKISQIWKKFKIS